MPANIPFSKLNHTNIVPLIQKAISDHRQGVKKLTKHRFHHHTFDSLMLELERLYLNFGKFWDPISHLNGVKKNDQYAAAYEQASELVTNYFNELYQNKKLYKAVRALQKSSHFKKDYTKDQQALVNDYITQFRLSGVKLKKHDAEKLKAIRKELAALKEKFGKNTTDARNAWTKHITDPALLEGIPENTLAAAQKLAADKGLAGWLLTLAPNVYMDVMQFAQNRELRKEFHQAQKFLATAHTPHPEFDNSQIMAQIIKLRQEEARLLGFKDHVDLSLATKMAKRAEIEEMFVELTNGIKPQAQKEYDRLIQFAREYCQIEELQPYDLGFVSAKLKAIGFAVDDKTVKEYFPTEHVLQGMFDIVKKLFAIDIREEVGFDTWDPSVKLFSLYTEQGEKLGEIYMDLYARNGEKRSGAWMSECEHRFETKDSVHYPIAFLNTNFGQGTLDKPSLLSHQEVRTTFHEFGHCLHHILSKTPYPSIAGPNGVPWDAVEAPSQMMENWIWDAENLKRLSQHYKTGEPLPDSLIASMTKLRNYNSGIAELRQLCYAIFDFNLHTLQGDISADDIQRMWLATHNGIQVYKTEDDNFTPNSFSHIFSGAYSAGYYGYNWALNIAHNLFNRFKENGIMSPEIGQQYVAKVLEPGGSKPFMSMVHDFLGKAPDPKALAEALKTEVEPFQAANVAQPQQETGQKLTKRNFNQYWPLAKVPALLGIALLCGLPLIFGTSFLMSLVAGFSLTAGSTLLNIARENYKARSYEQFSQKASQETPSLLPGEKEAFDIGLSASKSYLVQAKSCFQPNCYQNMPAYYAALKAQEEGSAPELKRKFAA